MQWMQIMIFFLMLKRKKKMLWIVSQTPTARTLHLKDLTILALSAIPTSSTRRRLLSTWKSVQEQTQNLRCWSWSVLTASKTLKQLMELRSTLEFTSWDTLETSIICLNNFNNWEEVIVHMNISPWTNFELPEHRPICPNCQQTFEKMTKLRSTFVVARNGNIFYEICHTFRSGLPSNPNIGLWFL